MRAREIGVALKETERISGMHGYFAVQGCKTVRYIVAPLTQVESMRSETSGRCQSNGKTDKQHTMHRICIAEFFYLLSEHLGKGFFQELNEEVGYGQIHYDWSRKTD